MAKIIADHELVENIKLGDYYSILVLKSPDPLPEILPGNFAEIKVPDTENVFLRRPFSVYDVDYQKNTISFFIKNVGKGTAKLVAMKKGEKLNAFYPLGNSFQVKDSSRKVLLVGGGSGMAPFQLFGKKLKQAGINTEILIGGRTALDVSLNTYLEPLGKVHVTTEDASVGEEGFVTDHSVMKSLRDFDQVFCCGPEPMMQAVGKKCTDAGISCQVSLENMMACGIGVCICCVTETVDGLQKVCTEGPVFNIEKLAW